MAVPTNPYLTDSHLRPFLTPSFSPTDYLNTHLPYLPSTTSPTPSKPLQSQQSLTSLASQTQSHISALSAQQTRLSAVLTDLTDDILRTSSRLAYEVELLRGEAVSLAETLSAQSPLNESIKKLLPNGLPPPNLSMPAENGEGSKIEGGAPSSQTGPSAASPTLNAPLNTAMTSATGVKPNPNEPPALSNLRTLHQVRQQLQRVISLFNLALSFPIPPSMVTSSNLVSIQAPNPDPNAEKKAQDELGRIKGEIIDLLRAGGVEGRGKAVKRVEELSEVCELWKGTGEYKARVKWVEGLEALVGIGAEKEGEQGGKRVEEKEVDRRDISVPGKGESRSGTPALGIGGGGFLKRLRDEIYLDSS
ncbi:uncharacterized protein KY384_007196 [Bacidia gigantensis]|uniref:uncharacterized protein n=1 Tax=Bacidia gigantensis TaxID=2732470 RepID=UPI001D04977A|nr:uncharacterized protein KY384_007196 [Bacidia gigantensis]KAG8528279.1 hypothetical protein KY384_007196 [Bacidia gigantensis]